ncbi:MAG: hypothetical protein HGA72_06110, partial [Chlorobiaceae bacterium]|nr:hypothetical protein [Chlorobiaceae bacterium]
MIWFGRMLTYCTKIIAHAKLRLKLFALRAAFAPASDTALDERLDAVRDAPVEIVADFLHNLHPDDIRLIPVAQEHFTPEDHAYYDQAIRPQLLKLASEAYPFLLYRINNFFTVRGLHNSSLEKCYVVLDERTVGGTDIYPCNIYIRERGTPITSVID